MKKYILLTVIVLQSFVLSAADYNTVINKIHYTIHSDGLDSHAIATGRDDDLNDVVIPKNVTYQGKQYPVKRITGGFGGNELLSISLPEGLETIDIGAFCYCYNLKKANVPSTVKRIEDVTFKANFKLETIEIAEGVEYIGSNAFEDCRALKKVNIPSSVKVLMNCSFVSNVSLKEVTLHEGLQEIYPYAFANCYYLESIMLPSSLRKLGKGAFQACKRMESANVPGGIETSEELSLGKFAFARSGLKRVTLGAGLASIPEGMFELCENLEEVTIPGSVQTVGKHAFLFSGLKKVVIEDGVKKIEPCAFSMLANLNDLSLPSSVSIISSAFAPRVEFDDECFASNDYADPKHPDYVDISYGNRAKYRDRILTPFLNDIRVNYGYVDKVPVNLSLMDNAFLGTLNIDSGNPNFKVVDGVVYSPDMQSVVFFPRNYSKSVYEMPATVIRIDGWALSGLKTEKLFISPSIKNDGDFCMSYADISGMAIFPEALNSMKYTAPEYLKTGSGNRCAAITNLVYEIYSDAERYVTDSAWEAYGGHVQRIDFIPPEAAQGYHNICANWWYDLDEILYKNLIYNVEKSYDANSVTFAFTELCDIVECVDSMDSAGLPISKIADNTFKIGGLREWSWYTFHANVKFKGCSYTYPVQQLLYTHKLAAIDDISSEQDCEGEVEYYNLQGQRVERPASGTIVIRRSGGKAEKVVIK